MKTFTIVALAVTVGIILAVSIGYVTLVAVPRWEYERHAPARARLVKACEEYIETKPVLEEGERPHVVVTTNAAAEAGKDGLWVVRVDVVTDLAGSTLITRPAFCKFNADGTIQGQAATQAKAAARATAEAAAKHAEAIKIEAHKVTEPVTAEQKAALAAEHERAERIFKELQKAKETTR